MVLEKLSLIFPSIVLKESGFVTENADIMAEIKKYIIHVIGKMK
jgi:hypothetical protein